MDLKPYRSGSLSWNIPNLVFTSEASSQSSKTLQAMIEELNLGPFIKKPILNSDRAVVGWTCYARDEIGNLLGSGTAVSLLGAQRAAISEYLEEVLVQKLGAAPNSQFDLMLETQPGRLGFAAGFDNLRTRYRAICAGLEVWAWENIFKRNLSLRVVSSQEMLSSRLTRQLFRSFEKVILCCADFRVGDVSLVDSVMRFHLVLGFQDGSLFVGGKVSYENEDGWTEATVRANRARLQHKIAKWTKTDSLHDSGSWSEFSLIRNSVEENAKTYGFTKLTKNSEEKLLSQIGKTQDRWPIAHPLMIRPSEMPFFTDVYLWRALFKSQ